MIAPLRSNEAGEKRAGERDEARDIGIDHSVDRVLVGVLQATHRRSEAGIVDQQVDRTGIGGHGFEGGGVAHVEIDPAKVLAQFAFKRGEPLGAAAGADHAPAGRDELARGGLADPGGGAGDENIVHFKRSNSQSQAVGQSSIRTWAAGAVGTAGASRGSATICRR